MRDFYTFDWKLDDSIRSWAGQPIHREFYLVVTVSSRLTPRLIQILADLRAFFPESVRIDIQTT